MSQPIPLNQNQPTLPGHFIQITDQNTATTETTKLFLGVVQKTAKERTSNGKLSSSALLSSDDGQSLISGNDRSKLKELLNNRQKYYRIMKETYGGNVDPEKAEAVRKKLLAWMNGDASRGKTPETVFLNMDLLGGAKSLGDASPQARSTISRTALEELAHALESQLRRDGQTGLDTQGDEGARFVALLTGDASAQKRLDKDDHGTVPFNGKTLAVEMRGLTAKGGASTLYEMVKLGASKEEFNKKWKEWGLSHNEKIQVFRQMVALTGSIDLYVQTKGDAKFSNPINEFARWAVGEHGGQMIAYFAVHANEMTNAQLDEHYNNWLKPLSYKEKWNLYRSSAQLIGFDRWYGLKCTRNSTELVKDIISGSIRYSPKFAKEAAKFLWDNVKGTKPKWNDQQVGKFLHDYVNSKSKEEIKEGMLAVQPDSRAWLNLSGTRSHARYKNSLSIADIIATPAPKVDYKQAAKTLHDMVSNRAADEEFNSIWQKWGYSFDDKVRIFEEMGKLQGGIGHYLDAKAGRKFTQPINEFAQWATTNYGVWVARFIADKGNGWSDWEYNQAFDKWISPAQSTKGFYTETSAIGFEHWDGLRGTRNGTSLVKAIFREGVNRDLPYRSGLNWTYKIAQKLADYVEEGHGGPSDDGFAWFYEKFVENNRHTAEKLAEEMYHLRTVRFWLNASHGRKFTPPLINFVQWAVKKHPKNLARSIAGVVNDWSYAEFDKLMKFNLQLKETWSFPTGGNRSVELKTVGLDVRELDQFFTEAAYADKKGAVFWLELKGNREFTNFVTEIVTRGIRNIPKFAQQTAQYLWDNVSGSSPKWHDGRIADIMGAFVNVMNRAKMREAMLKVQPDPQAWLNLHGTRSTATVGNSLSIADVIKGNG